MIKRELYLERIRPFMHKDLIKVITGVENQFLIRQIIN